MKQTYIIKQWFISWGCLVGNVYGHPFFIDGSRIRTTKIISKDGNKFETKNSFYIVEGD